MKVYLITRQVWGYDDSFEVRGVVASEELAEAWAEHYRRQDHKDADYRVEAWPVEELPPVVAR